MLLKRPVDRRPKGKMNEINKKYREKFIRVYV